MTNISPYGESWQNTCGLCGQQYWGNYHVCYTYQPYTYKTYPTTNTITVNLRNYAQEIDDLKKLVEGMEMRIKELERPVDQQIRTAIADREKAIREALEEAFGNE